MSFFLSFFNQKEIKVFEEKSWNVFLKKQFSTEERKMMWG